MAFLSSLILRSCLLATLFSFVFVTSAAATQRRRELLKKTLETLQSTESNVHVHKPTRISRTGRFIDVATIDALSHVTKNGKVHPRSSSEPRSVREKLDASSATDDGNHEVFFNLGHAPGSPLSGARLHLKRNYKLVSENFIVEERSHGGKINQRHSLIHDCHYTGVIHNHNSFSKVALSLCNGLQGVILKDEDAFFIEPLWNYTNSNQSKIHFSTTSSPVNNTSDDFESHPHVIVKRSALEHLNSRRKNKNDLGHCGYSDKVRGDVPWWRIDPRDKDQLSQQKESYRSEHSDKNNHNRERNHHHNRLFNHRTSTGRMEASRDRAGDGRSKRSVDDAAKSRISKSVSLERNVEAMVVADKMLVGYHGRKEVEKYILTIMNMVSSLYHDASIGNAVNIIVTRIVLLTEDQPNLHISHHADNSLNSFCMWQRSINVNGTNDISDNGLAHHDNAILMTGFDICTFKDEPCGTLGLAPVAGMCESERSCNINEDTGLSSAYTIAHEIGHNFGMQHDGTNNPCGPDSGAPSQIMAAQLTKNTSPFTWSGCSKNYITRFLDSGAGKCLLDTPPMRYFSFPEEMPGQMHDAEEQCRFQYGPQSRQCKIGNICRELWCLSKNGRCITNSVPAAEGTSCSTDIIDSGWCYRGNCVRFGYRPKAVDGGWGHWTTWDECSRSCGSGISSSTRTCNNPIPEHGGKFCVGERRRHKICNLQPCPPSSRDFRHEQCATFDTEPFRGKYYNWLPFVGGHNSKPCALNCLAQGYNFYTERAAAVVDGTRCTANSLDICISGECHHVGCDNVLHSDAIEDKCRVCGGDGSTCQTQAGVFNQPVLHGRYHDVVTIPRGSVNIFIEELEISRQNYIALKNTRGRNFINGAWTIDWPRKFEIAGTTFNYERSATEPETLQALGPTDDDLVIMVLLQEPNRGIRYEYNVLVERESSGQGAESAFLWDYDDWTPCTVTCAGGVQRRPIICRRVDDDTVVQHSYCDRNTKPVEQQQICNQEPCAPEWNVGQWLECSRTCGGGRRTRSVVCMRKLSQTESEIVNNRLCVDEKPDRSESCNDRSCPAIWKSHQWSQCTASCGGGFKSRRVSCVSTDHRTQFNDTACDQMLKPSTRVRCNQRSCRRSVWKTKRWSSCSGECGVRGTKRRRVVCLYHRTSIHSKDCSSSNKPKSIMSCETPCTQVSRNTSSDQCIDDPKVHYCPLVKRFKFCRRSYFRKMCCQTCSR